jgi:hypothetical protein
LEEKKMNDDVYSRLSAGSPPGRRSHRTRLGLVALLAVFTLTACYPAQYREVGQTGPGDAVVRERPPQTQVYFYPKQGQTQQQQARDHYECYNWAVKQTNFDPSRSSIPLEERIQVVPLPPPGFESVRMAIAGAVLGALIAGHRNAGSGALIGAASGVIAGAVSDAARHEQARQMEQAYTEQSRLMGTKLTEKEINFKRAMSACLEGRGYSVQ